MNIISLIIAIMSFGFGLITIFKQKTRLFYKVVVFSAGSYLLAVIYRILYAMFIPTPDFHAGYLAYMGTFLFLLSGFFAEPKECLHVHKIGSRILAFLPAMFIVICGVWNVKNGHSIISQILLIPVAATVYYAFRFLCQRSKDCEYAHSLRIYHFVLLLFCLIQPFVLVAMLTRENTTLPILCHSVLSTVLLMSAYWGCKRWSI